MRVVYAAFATALVLGGCDRGGPKPSPAPTSDHEAAASVAPVAPFNAAEFAKLSDRVSTLEADAKYRAVIEDMDGMLFLKPDDNRWQVLKTELGSLAVSLDNVSEYANGSEVTIDVGNPLSASLEGVSAHIEWGRVDNQGSPTGQILEKDIEFTDEIPAGGWHNLKVMLAGLPPKDLGFVRMKDFKYKAIKLREPY